MHNILINVPELNRIGGVANYYKVIELNKEKNIDYFVIHSSEKNVFKRLTKKYIEFWRKIDNYDLIHINPSLDFKSYYRDMLFIILAKLKKKKVLVFFRGWQDSFEEKIKRSKIQKYLFNVSYGKVDGFIVLGKIFKEKVLNLLNNKNILFFIETTIIDSDNNFDINQKVYDKEINILFLSRIEKEKGIYIVIDTFKELVKKHDNINLIIAGDGSELKNAKRYAKGVENIQFIGFIKSNEKYKILKNSHIFFFPTYYGEGLPNAILEAMYYGMPIISRNNAAIPEIVKEDNGYLLDSIDYKDYIPILENLIKNPKLIEEIGKKNHKKAKENYTKEKVKERILKIYEKIC